MAQGFWGSICLEDLFAGKIAKGSNGKDYICLQDLESGTPFSKSEKNGKHYVSIGAWLNDELDQHGNIMSMTWSQTKDQAAAKEKRQYIGNLKPNQRNAAPAAQPQAQNYPPQAQSYPPQQSYPQAGYGQQPAQRPQGNGYAAPPAQQAQQAPQYSDDLPF